MQPFRDKLACLMKQGISDEYVQDAARRAAAVTLATSAGAGLAAGGITYAALSEDSLRTVAESLSRKLRLPLSIAMAVVTGFFSGRVIGLPTGALYGVASAGRGNHQKPPGRDDSVTHLMGT